MIENISKEGKIFIEQMEEYNKEAISKAKNKISLSYFSRKHNRSRQRVYDALRGDAPGLLYKMKSHLNLLFDKIESNGK